MIKLLLAPLAAVAHERDAAARQFARRAGAGDGHRQGRNEDDVERKGEAIGAMVGGQLYLTTYEAPAIYFFDRDLEKFRQLVNTLKI